jgi:hypothetical protein
MDEPLTSATYTAVPEPGTLGILGLGLLGLIYLRRMQTGSND